MSLKHIIWHNGLPQPEAAEVSYVWNYRDSELCRGYALAGAKLPEDDVGSGKAWP